LFIKPFLNAKVTPPHLTDTLQTTVIGKHVYNRLRSERRCNIYVI